MFWRDKFKTLLNWETRIHALRDIWLNTLSGNLGSHPDYGTTTTRPIGRIKDDKTSANLISLTYREDIVELWY